MAGQEVPALDGEGFLVVSPKANSRLNSRQFIIKLNCHKH